MPNKNKRPAKPRFSRRLAALLIDYCIILGYMALLAATIGLWYLATGTLPDWLGYGVMTAELLGFLVLVLPVGLYLYFSEASVRQATIGKRALNLVVVSATTLRRPSRTQIAVRTIIKLLPWEVAHFFVWHTVAATARGQSDFPLWLEIGLVGSIILPIVYVLMVAFDVRGRGPHDRAARTRVIAAKMNS